MQSWAAAPRHLYGFRNPTSQRVNPKKANVIITPTNICIIARCHLHYKTSYISISEDWCTYVPSQHCVQMSSLLILDERFRGGKIVHTEGHLKNKQFLEMEVAPPHKLLHCFHFLNCLHILGKRLLCLSYNTAITLHGQKRGMKWLSGLDAP